jgi:hypothetical protein
VVLSCIGAAAPAAEWARYAADAASIPTTCADASPRFAASAPAVTLFDRGYRGARTWRATLSAQRSLTPRSGVSLDALVVHGTRLPTAIDRNLRASPAFALAGERRPVYAALTDIDPVSGGIAPGAGRVLPGFGAVDEIASAGRSWTAQLGAGMGGSVGRMLMTFRYTFTHARIRGGGIHAPGAGETTTAGDPARLEWMDAPFTPAHHLFANLTAPLFRRVRLSAIGTLATGLPFTPMVGADVNGDGRANDRAFIFGPDDAPDAGVAAGMRRLMEEGPAGVRGCLRAGVGRIAAPGACRTPWSPSLDLRAELTPFGALNARRFVLAIDARNVTAGVDYLLHRPHRLRGWGQPASADPALLQVRGFDPARRAFLYDVNPRFGRPSQGGQQRLPFRLVVEGRFTVGADPRYQPLMRAIELNSGQSRESILAELSGRLRNVPAAILQLDAGDTTALALSPAQRAFLRAAADSLAPRFAAAVDSLATAFTSRASPVVAAARLQELGMRAASLQEAAISRARAVLSGEQWNRVPAWLARPAEPDELLRSPRFQVTIDG